MNRIAHSWRLKNRHTQNATTVSKYVQTITLTHCRISKLAYYHISKFNSVRQHSLRLPSKPAPGKYLFK